MELTLNKSVLYVGRCFPNQNAAGIRVYNIAQLLKKHGCDVTFLCNVNPTEKSESDFNYEIVPYRLSRRFLRICNLWDILTGYFTYKAFLNCVRIYDPKVVILYNETQALSKKILRYCRKHHRHIFMDVTEWYTVKHISENLSESLLTKSVDRRIRKIDQRSDGIIAISTYLEEYYKKFGLPVVNIPPIVIVPDDISNRYRKDNSVLKLIYAGSPGTKDILETAVTAVEKFNQKRIKAELHLYGLTNQDVLRLFHVENASEKGIIAHGRVSHGEAMEAVQAADYTILFRHNQRYAKAGFSTKVAESMYLGTPVICNVIGGTDREIEDNRNGFLLPDASEESIYTCLERLCAMDKDEYFSLRKKTRDFARKRYSPESYKTELMEMIGFAE